MYNKVPKAQVEPSGRVIGIPSDDSRSTNHHKKFKQPKEHKLILLLSAKDKQIIL
jgi:hypothetical protein